MRTLTASDRSILTRLASGLPTGSFERRTILAGIAKQAIEFTSDEQMQKYLKEHPKADPKKHSVKEKGGKGKGEGKSREIKSADGKDPHHVMGAAGGNKVFMGNYTVKHLQTHAQPGKGSVFSGKIKPEDISAAINKIPAKFFEEGGGAFEIDVPNAGSDLVQKSSDILKKYPNAKKITVPKQEGVVMGEDGKPKMGEDGKPIPKMVDVTAYVVDDGEDAFSTNKMTVVLRPANPQFMPEEAKKDEELSGALNDKKGFAVLTAFPGKKDVPKASEWGDEYAIIVPNGGKGADADVQKALGSSKKGFVIHHPQEFGSMRKLSSIDRSALIRLASSLPEGSPERRAILASLDKTAKVERFVGEIGGYLYAVQIEGVNPRFAQAAFGRQLDDLRLIEAWKNGAKKDWVSTKPRKGQKPLPELKKWLASVGPREFYAKWDLRVDDDTRVIYFK